MSSEAFEVAQAVLLALGGGGAIVLALATWIGKATLERIISREKHQFDERLSRLQAELDSLKEKGAINYKEKLELYKTVANPLIEITILLNKTELTQSDLDVFDLKRLNITAQLVLFSPENVIHSFLNIVDYIYNSTENKKYEFKTFRVMAMQFLSEMRKDIGIYSDDIAYKGSR